MKIFLKNFAFFIVLAFVFSSLTGCQTATSEKGPGNTTTSSSSNTETADKKKSDSSEYPAPPSSIAQADIKMIDAGNFKLEDNKGKVILFNLWGIWCGPCIAEMPHLIEMKEKYKDKGFEIVGLNVGNEDGQPESEAAIKEFAEKRKLNYALGYADRKLFDEFSRTTKLAGVPQSVLINREGKMVGIFTGGGPRVIAQMKQTVDKTLAE